MIKVFDLKGSTYQRRVIEPQLYNNRELLNSIRSHLTHTSTTVSSQGADGGVDFGDMPLDLKQFLKKNDETLKDLDFINLTRKYSETFDLNLKENEHKAILKLIENDVEFLRCQHVMDYSILIGIEEITAKPGFLENENSVL